MRPITTRLLVVLSTLCVLPSWAFAQSAAEKLISRPDAARHGLVRQWFTHLEIGIPGSRIESIAFENGTLFVQTTGGLLHAVDAESGRTIWTSELGGRGGENFIPAVNHTYVATLTGTTLTVLRRADGVVHWTRKSGGVPSASVGLTDELVMVPTVGGVIEGYRLTASEEEFRPIQFNASGKNILNPLATADGIYFTLSNGHFQGFYPKSGTLRLTWKGEGPLYSTPGYAKPYLFVGSANGFVYAVDEQNASVAWQYSTGDAVRESPIAIGDRVYILPEFGGVHAISAVDGSQVWSAPRVEQFVAASSSRLYFTDRRNQMHVLDAKTGALVDSFPLHARIRAFTNVYSDRIYLIFDDGMVQCLREIGQDQPIIYRAAIPAPAAAPAEGAEAAPGSAAPGAPAVAPAPAPEPEEVPGEVEDNPFE